jgi:ABC-type taurine transport system ATPase subunit
MIEATGLTKRYGATVAVDDLSFTVPPGQVTGFLGPNGAGKSTTMRQILGLDAPDSGSVTVGGRPYAARRRPLFQAGALLEAKAFHGGRSARNHLLCLALSNGISRARVDEVLDLVGLRSVARRRAVLALLGFGLGTVMRSSAGAVAALFGVLFVPTLLTALLPSSWQDTLGPYLPMNAGDAIYTVRPEAHMLGPWAGFGVFCLYAAAVLAAGFALIGRRDA